MRLVLGAGRPVDLFTCHQNCRSLCRHLNRVQTPTQSRWSQPVIIVLSCTLGAASGSRKVKWNVHSKDRGVGREPSIARVQFQGQTAEHVFLMISLNTAMLSWNAGGKLFPQDFLNMLFHLPEMLSSQTLPCLLLDFHHDYTEMLATGCYCSVMFLFNICYLNIFNWSNRQCWQSKLTFWLDLYISNLIQVLKRLKE